MSNSIRRWPLSSPGTISCPTKPKLVSAPSRATQLAFIDPLFDGWADTSQLAGRLEEHTPTQHRFRDMAFGNVTHNERVTLVAPYRTAKRTMQNEIRALV